MSTPEAITAAGGVLFREKSAGSVPEVLLIFRRGVWDLPKGKLEEGESIRECAAREVAEEIGIDTKPQVLARLADTYHEYELQDKSFGKTTHWFAMEQLSDDFEFHPQIEEGIEKVEWYRLSDALTLVGYRNLIDVLESFEKWYGTLD